MTGTQITADGIARLIASHRYEFDTEVQLHEGIAIVLISLKIPFEREVRINANDRLDFLTDGGVAIEAKIHGTRPSVLTQLHRYAQSDRVAALILVTRKARHLSMPTTLNGKEVYVASLLGGSF